MTPRSFTPKTGLREIREVAREALHGSAASRQIEQLAASALPPHTLMSRAGLAIARLALALQPHARSIWVACGPGNNGGDGLVAAMHLHRWAQDHGAGPQVRVTHVCEDPTRVPMDARQALAAARDAGVMFIDEPPSQFDLGIDALLGIGTTRPPEGRLAHSLKALRESDAPVLCVDLPSGLSADTGALLPLSGAAQVKGGGPRHTLSLLTLKPGLFTGAGRDAAGSVWLDDLGAAPHPETPVTAWLAGQTLTSQDRPHASHKGSFGDVLVLGGQSIAVHGVGMTGAAVLAARAALHAGAGRVFVGLLEGNDEAHPTHWEPACPELMFRRLPLLLEPGVLSAASTVCGCGGGTSVAAVLPRVLSLARTLVLDADALNAVANDPALQTLLEHRRGRGGTTVLTPHPLEAARLLGTGTQDVMADRLLAAQALADRFGSVCVLKGSGTVLASPGQVPLINASGNALLATAGTGDVLAGMIGSALAPSGLTVDQAWKRVAAAVHRHGWLADHWNDEAAPRQLSASRLATRIQSLN